MAARSSRPPPSGGRIGHAATWLAAVTLLSVASGCAGQERSFFAAYGKAGSTELELNVDSCNESLTAEVKESATQVRVTVTSDRRLGRSRGDCADSVTVSLAEPLGTRRLVDESTGEVVAVQAPD